MQRIYLSPPHMSSDERRLLLDAFDSNWIAPLGPHVDAFEAEFADYVGMPHATALSSGTAALHLALLVHGVQPGDVVIIQSFTFAATANAAVYAGARPVFVDSEPQTWCLDPDAVGDAIRAERRAGNRVGAVVAVDLYGLLPDVGRVQEVCREHGVPFIEDAAEALGSRVDGQSAGTFGDSAIFSFNGNKIITTSGGGMFVSHDESLAKRVRYLATQARQPVLHYEHTDVGFNYRLSNLLAAVGRGQLMHLDERVASRAANRAHYASMLGTRVEFAPIPEGQEPNHWLTCVLFEEQTTRDAVIEHLAGQSIESRPLWKPMHLQPVFADCTHHGGSVCEGLFERGLCLPSGSALTPTDRERVADAVIEGMG